MNQSSWYNPKSTPAIADDAMPLVSFYPVFVEADPSSPYSPLPNGSQGKPPKATIKASPKYKVCKVKMQHQLDASKNVATLSMDMSISESESENGYGDEQSTLGENEGGETEDESCDGVDDAADLIKSKSVLKAAPKYKVCSVKMQQQLDASKQVNTMSTGLSIDNIEHSADYSDHVQNISNGASHVAIENRGYENGSVEGEEEKSFLTEEDERGEQMQQVASKQTKMNVKYSLVEQNEAVENRQKESSSGKRQQRSSRGRRHRGRSASRERSKDEVDELHNLASLSEQKEEEKSYRQKESRSDNRGQQRSSSSDRRRHRSSSNSSTRRKDTSGDDGEGEIKRSSSSFHGDFDSRSSTETVEAAPKRERRKAKVTKALTSSLNLTRVRFNLEESQDDSQEVVTEIQDQQQSFQQHPGENNRAHTRGPQRENVNDISHEAQMVFDLKDYQFVNNEASGTKPSLVSINPTGQQRPNIRTLPTSILNTAVQTHEENPSPKQQPDMVGSGQPTNNSQIHANINMSMANPNYEYEVSTFLPSMGSADDDISALTPPGASKKRQSRRNQDEKSRITLDASIGTNLSMHDYDARGRCTHHPHIKLRKKKLFGRGWTILMGACPDCCVEELRRAHFIEEEKRLREEKKSMEKKERKKEKNKSKGKSSNREKRNKKSKDGKRGSHGKKVSRDDRHNRSNRSTNINNDSDNNDNQKIRSSNHRKMKTMRPPTPPTPRRSRSQDRVQDMFQEADASLANAQMAQQPKRFPSNDSRRGASTVATVFGESKPQDKFQDYFTVRSTSTLSETEEAAQRRSDETASLTESSLSDEIFYGDSNNRGRQQNKPGIADISESHTPRRSKTPPPPRPPSKSPSRDSFRDEIVARNIAPNEVSSIRVESRGHGSSNGDIDDSNQSRPRHQSSFHGIASNASSKPTKRRPTPPPPRPTSRSLSIERFRNDGSSNGNSNIDDSNQRRPRRQSSFYSTVSTASDKPTKRQPTPPPPRPTSRSLSIERFWNDRSSNGDIDGSNQRRPRRQSSFYSTVGNVSDKSTKRSQTPPPPRPMSRSLSVESFRSVPVATHVATPANWVPTPLPPRSSSRSSSIERSRGSSVTNNMATPAKRSPTPPPPRSSSRSLSVESFRGAVASNVATPYQSHRSVERRGSSNSLSALSTASIPLPQPLPLRRRLHSDNNLREDTPTNIGARVDSNNAQYAFHETPSIMEGYHRLREGLVDSNERNHHQRRWSIRSGESDNSNIILDPTNTTFVLPPPRPRRSLSQDTRTSDNVIQKSYDETGSVNKTPRISRDEQINSKNLARRNRRLSIGSTTSKISFHSVDSAPRPPPPPRRRLTSDDIYANEIQRPSNGIESPPGYSLDLSDRPVAANMNLIGTRQGATLDNSNPCHDHDGRHKKTEGQQPDQQPLSQQFQVKQGKIYAIQTPYTDKKGRFGVYNGQVNDSLVPHGIGTMEYDNGTVKVGEWKNGRYRRKNNDGDDRSGARSRSRSKERSRSRSRSTSQRQHPVKENTSVYI